MMAVNGKVQMEALKKVKTILVTQPKPERSPYYDLEKKYELQIDWRPFIHVEPIAAQAFRKQRIYPEQYAAVILTSKNAVDHFFRLCEEMRIKMSQETKYFCLTEQIANYLQKFIIYRKRKVFSGTKSIEDLGSALKKHKTEKFLLPCSNLGAKDVTSYLEAHNYAYQDAMMYQTVSSDLSDLSDVTYDVLVFFSPLDLKSLYDNFPNFKQNDTRIAIFGNSTGKEVEERGLTINITAPIPDAPSMPMALEKYLQVSNKES